MLFNLSKLIINYFIHVYLFMISKCLLFFHISFYSVFVDNMPVILSSFSFVRNGRDLIKYNKNNDLNIFNGLKVVAMILVLFGHKFLYAATGPIMNGKLPEKVNKFKK